MRCLDFLCAFLDFFVCPRIYDKTICIEHEDPVWSGTEEKVKRGILKTRDHVSQFFM